MGRSEALDATVLFNSKSYGSTQPADWIDQGLGVNATDAVAAQTELPS